MDRRAFMQASIGAASWLSLAQTKAAPPGEVAPFTPNPITAAPNQITSSTVVLYNDAAPISPVEQVQRLARFTAAMPDPSDQYLKGRRGRRTRDARGCNVR